jgi:LysM repeat protein
MTSRRTSPTRLVTPAGVGVAVTALSLLAPPAAADAATSSPGTVLTAPVAALPAPAGLPPHLLAAPTAPTHRRYLVVEGDTVSTIARRTGSTVAAIVAANDLDARAFIRVGQVLTIPRPGAAPTPPAVEAPAGERRHTVVAGDTVWDLARRHGSSTAEILASNGLDHGAVIRVGQVLVIPATGGSSAPTAAPAGGRHVVVAGDTVSALARRYGTTTTAIVAANGLGARAVIQVGQTLTIPRPGALPSPPMSSTFAGRTYPGATVAAARANRAALLARAVPSRAQMQRLVHATATAMGVDPALALAVAHQESGFDQRAVSPANAVGTMQVIPSSGRWAAQLVGRPLDLLDPEDNVTAGVAILRQLLRSASSLDAAIASYYQGLGSVRRHGMFADTRRYVANVRALLTRFA